MRIWLPQGFEAWRFVVYPVVLLLMMLLRPQGLMGKFELGFLRARKWPLRARSKTGDTVQAAVGGPGAEEVGSL
jgi:branched-chain amino acid transport system permease protein